MQQSRNNCSLQQFFHVMAVSYKRKCSLLLAMFIWTSALSIVQASSLTSAFYQPNAGVLQESWFHQYDIQIPYWYSLNIGYPDCPHSAENINKFEWTGPGYTYSHLYKRFRSYFISPETGTHKFFIACNFQCQFHIEVEPGTTESLLYQTTASVGWTQRAWSNALELLKGFRYKVEVLYFGYASSCFLKVGVQFPNGTELKPLDGRVLQRSMEFYRTNRLFVEQFSNIQYPPVQSFESFIQIPTNAAKYPDNPSAVVCRQSIYDSVGNTGDHFALRYTGYFVPAEIGNYTFQLKCNNFCQMNVTNAGRKTVTAVATSEIDVGEMKKGYHYKIEIFLAEDRYQDWLQVKYMRRQLEGNGVWNIDWTGQLKNLSPSEAGHSIHPPALTIINSTTINVIVGLPRLPSGDNWTYANVYDIVYQDSAASFPKTILRTTDDLPSYRSVANLSKNSLYTFHIHYYGYIDGLIEYNVISRKKSVKTDEDVPDAYPSNIVVRAMSSTSIQLQWSPLLESAPTNGLIKGYEVKYAEKKAVPKIWIPYDIIGAGNRLPTISDLRKYTVYEFKVAAKTSKGSGVFSPVMEMKTLEDKPSAPPSNIVAENTSSTSIRISWGYVPADHRNGIITGYKVYYKQYLESSDISSITLPARSIEIPRLHYWTVYQMNVSALTSIGEGPLSNGTQVRTDEERPGGPPQSLIATSLTSTSMKLDWLEIDPTLRFGIILSYKIKYQRRDKKDVSKEMTSSNRTAVISGLNEYTDYDMSVAGTTSKGDGIFSAIVTQRTLEDLPAGVPRSVRGNFLSATEIFLEWDNIPIEDQNGLIIAYNITYKMKHSADVWESTMNSTSRTVSIKGLAYYTIYEFKVAGKTAVGQGPFSSPVDIRTDAHGPTAAPIKVSGRTINASSIAISWSRVPKEQRHGIILGYKLSVKDESISDREWINHTIPFTENGELNTTRFNQTLTNLKIYTPYAMKILAYNYRGEGPFSENVTIRTGDFIPSGIPKNVSKENTTSTGITLSWLPMEEIHGEANGKVIGYRIQYQVVDCHIDRPAGCDENEVFTIFSPSSTSHITMQNLRKYTNYSISVQVVTNKGNGTFSAPIYIKTNEDKPDDTPKQVESWPSKINTIKLYWSPIPESLRNGIILAYRIFYKPIDVPVRNFKRAPRSVNRLTAYGALPGEKMKIVNPTTYETELDGLKDYSWYQIRIGAVTSKGLGVTFTINGTSKQRAPVAAPTFNIVDNYGFYEISLNWDSISRTAARGEVLGHRIYYWPTEQNDVAVTKETVSTVDVFEPKRSLKIKNLQPYTTYRVNISAFTEGGFGTSSKCKEAETCRCPKMLTSSWTTLSPLVIRGTNISGIMPKHIDKAVASCCGNCTFGQGPSSVDWTHDATNASSFKHSREILKKAILAGTHITIPFFKDTIESEGSESTEFDYVPMIVSPGMAIFKKKQSKTEIGNQGAKNLVESMMGLYPILILMALFTVIAGIIFWILDGGAENELIPNNFINGCGSGIWLAFVTMTTAGYGDIYPKSKSGRIFAIIWTLVGIVITSLVVGQIVTALNAKIAVVPVAGSNNKEPNSKMMASNETLMIAITKLRQRTISGNTSDPETIKQSLLSGKATKVMIEAYEAGQHKEALTHPDIEFDKLEKVDSSYGVVLAGESRRIKSCLKRYLKENSPTILQELAAHSVSLKKSESDSMQGVVTILSKDADLTMQIMKFGGAVLLVLVIFGAVLELKRSFRGRAKVTMQKCKTVELFEEVDQMIENLMANLSCKLDEIQLKQSKEIIKLCRMDVKDLKAIAPELIIFNEDLRKREDEKPYQSAKYVYKETSDESDVDMPIDYIYS